MAPGGDALDRKAVRFIARAAGILLVADRRRRGRFRADEFQTRLRSRPSASNGARCSTSSGPRSTAGAGCRVRLCRSPAAAGCRAFDPRSMPALVQLNARDLADLQRHRAQSGAGAAAVRHRVLSRRAAERRAGQPPLSHYQADFRPVDLFDAGPAGYDAVFSLEPGAGDGLPSRTFARPVEVQITGSLLIYDIADPAGRQGRAGQGAGGAISRHAPLHPRRLCALRLHPLRRALCGVDPVPRHPPRARGGWPAARPIRWPNASSRHCASPAACPRGRASTSRRGRRATGRALAPISPIVRPATSSRTAAITAKAAAPISTPIRRSAFRWKHRLSSTRNRTAGPATDDRSARRQ